MRNLSLLAVFIGFAVVMGACRDARSAADIAEDALCATVTPPTCSIPAPDQCVYDPKVKHCVGARGVKVPQVK